MKSFVNVVCLFLIWLLMMVFAHDYLAQKLNQKNQTLINKITKGSHDLELDDMQLNQVVKSFRSHWQSTPDGLVALVPKPEVSIELKGFIIAPKVHQFMKVSTKLVGSDSQGLVKIEFSNQQKQLYYDSEEISLNQLSTALNLNAINWTQNDLNQAKRTTVEWSEIGPLDAWVMRFYPNKVKGFTLNAVAIEQDAPVRLTPAKQQGCSHLDIDYVGCMMNNKMRYLNQSALYELGVSTINYPSFLASSPWNLFVLAWVLTLLLIFLFMLPSPVVSLMVTAVYLTIFILHQSWMFDLAAVFRWSLLVMFIVLIWLYRQVFYTIQNHALPVWLISGMMAVGLISLGGFKLDFIQSLPVYFLWASVQQVLIGPIFSTRIHRYLNTSKLMTACLVGVLFSIIHAPNHMLMLVTLVSGIVWSYAWLKYENIYANSFSHALLALVFYQSMPTQWLGSARIGAFF